MFMKVCKASHNHIEDIVNLNRLFHIALPEFRWDTNEWVTEEIQKNNYFIIKDSKKIYGAICIELSDGEGCVEAIAIQKDKQKTGIGRQLIEFAKTYTKKKDGKKLIVESFCEYNADAFYEKCGFTKINEIGYYENKPYYKFFMDL